jgi:hypothetical protein
MTLPMFICTFSLVKLTAKSTKVSQAEAAFRSNGLLVELELDVSLSCWSFGFLDTSDSKLSRSFSLISNGLCSVGADFEARSSNGRL